MAHTFSVEQKTVLSLLAAMQPICSKRTTLDATSNILFHVGHKELVLKATDLEISLQVHCPLIASNVDQAHSFLVHGKRIFDIIKELEGDIAFTLTDSQLGIQANAVDVALNIKSADEFPPFPERIENLMQLNTQQLLGMLDKVAFLIPQNNANPALNGLFVEIGPQELKMTSTDGHCLAQVTTDLYKLDEEKTWLLPRRAIFEMKKLTEQEKQEAVFLGVCGNQLVFSGQSFNFFTKVLADKFPQYQPIMNKEGFKPAQLDRSRFVKTLRRSSCLLSGQFLATSFEFSKDKLHVAMHNKEVGKLEEELPLAHFEGQELDIRFYSPYLLNGLQTFSDEQVTCYLNNPSRPIIFEMDKEKYHVTYLVMPVSPTANA